MAAFADLDLRAGSDLKALRGLVETAAHLGYSVVAINHIVDFKEKKREIEKPVAVSELFTTLPIVQGKSRPIKILTRLTIIVTDPSHCNVLRATSSRVRLYDIVAVFPKTEKLFHVACTHLDVDLVCITVTEKLPFYFKRPPINVALQVFISFSFIGGQVAWLSVGSVSLHMGTSFSLDRVSSGFAPPPHTSVAVFPLCSSCLYW
nr:ribonuclease P protein subunit p30 isoform X1 [Rattus norvegicus]